MEVFIGALALLFVVAGLAALECYTGIGHCERCGVHMAGRKHGPLAGLCRSCVHEDVNRLALQANQRSHELLRPIDRGGLPGDDKTDRQIA